jgi:hypothetical protein
MRHEAENLPRGIAQPGNGTLGTIGIEIPVAPLATMIFDVSMI